MSATVPRVAESLADLRVGQWIAYRTEGDKWEAGTVDEGDLEGSWALGGGRVVILADVPAEPITVTAEAVERLREAVGPPLPSERHAFTVGGDRDRLLNAARDLLDAIDGAGE